MSYPTKDEFTRLIKNEKLETVVHAHLLSGIPFAFAKSPGLYAVLRSTIASSLQLGETDITVVGSGRLGFSLDPDRFGMPYSESRSDIDTVIVSAKLFDDAWLELCRRGRRTRGLNVNVRNSISNHRTNNIFYGYMEPHALLGAITLSDRWFDVFQGIGRDRHLAGLDVQARLYRTWDHVEVHQVYSLRAIAESL